MYLKFLTILYSFLNTLNSTSIQGSTTISEVESYNPLSNIWQEMWKINQHKSALSACVVSQLENGQQYTWLRRELSDNYSKVNLNRSLPRRNLVTV
jgi:hypothetical protein